MRKVFIWSVIAFIQVMPFAAQAGDIRQEVLEGRFDSLIPKGAKWSLSVVNMENGKEMIKSGNAKETGLMPASLMKLFTAGAAFDLAKRGGIDMATGLVHDGAVVEGILRGNLYIVGRGNALLSTGDLKRSVQRMAGLGIKKIEGDLVADDSLFSGSVKRTRRGPAYAVPSALGLDLHTVAVIVSPSAVGGPPKISVSPQNGAVKFAVEARTVKGMKNTIKIRKSADNLYRVEGNIPVRSAGYRQRFSVDDPALYAAGVLMTLLEGEGISLSGGVRKGKAPNGTKHLTEMDAPPLKKVMREMNVNSLNVVADNLLLFAGAGRFGAPGTAEKGIAAMESFLSAFPRGGDREGGREVSLADGSGLSRKNRITAGLLAGYLREVSMKEWYPDFRESLARPGIDGIEKELDYKNARFRVKSGRLEEAYGLAGYGVDNFNREFSFAFMMNGSRGDIVGAERTGADLLRILAGADNVH